MTLPGAADTIAALATPAGRGALAVLRISGPAAWTVTARCLRGAHAEHPPEPRVATRVRLHDPQDDAPLDDALLTWFPAPHSFTGDAVVELSTHGGHIVPARVLTAILSAGAREAFAGEFTRRAFLAGKLDLLQAEAIGDLIDARSSAQARAAMAQLDGGLSRRLAALRQACLQLEALLAYDIDFPEEDDGPVAPTRIAEASQALLASLEGLLLSAPAVPLLREGAVVVLAGIPNVGKSSLFNAMLGEARAIVADLPGTTRDALDVMLDTDGVPIRLVDTAGMRETHDQVERLGIEVSARWLARAQLVLACGATEEEIDATMQAIGKVTEAPCLRVLTKQDDARPARLASMSALTAPLPALAASHVTSAERGLGLSTLLAAITHTVAARYGVLEHEVPRLTRERHKTAITAARDEIQLFGDAWAEGAGVPAVIAAVHVRAAVAALDDLIGVVTLDDVLDRLFGEFCVGK